MNITQANVAHAINNHLKRERRLMPRQFSVDLLNEDVNHLINDLTNIFAYQNISFKADDFRACCLKDLEI